MTYRMNRQQRIRELESASKLQNFYNSRLKDYDMGIMPQLIDNRTTYEQLQDNVAMYQNLRNKVYELFNNDAGTSEDFLKEMENQNIKSEDFLNVFNDLKQRYRGTLVFPSNVISTTKTLIKTFNETGNTTGSVNKTNNNDVLIALENFKNNILPQLGLTNKQAEDFEEKIDALEYVVQEDENILSGETKKEATKQLRDAILDIYDYDGDDEQGLQDIITKLSRITTAIMKVYSKENDFKTRNEVIQKGFNNASEFNELNKELINKMKDRDDIINRMSKLDEDNSYKVSKSGKKGGTKWKEYDNLDERLQVVNDEINTLTDKKYELNNK